MTEKKRGRPKKIVEKSEGLAVEKMTSFLKVGKVVVTGKEIIKGIELKHAPVKKEEQLIKNISVRATLRKARRSYTTRKDEKKKEREKIKRVGIVNGEKKLWGEDTTGGNDIK